MYLAMVSHVCSPDCRVKTPNYEVYGAMTVDIRVNISGEGWTVNKIQFNYFANTSAKNCLAYGPGLLPQVRSAGVTWWSIILKLLPHQKVAAVSWLVLLPHVTQHCQSMFVNANAINASCLCSDAPLKLHM